MGSLFSEIRFRLRALFRRAEVERELAAEVRHHIEFEADRLMRQGVPADDAHRRARIEFGSIENVMESSREARGVTVLEHLAQDLRYAVRTLANHPAYTVAAVLSLALGIGANTAIFSALDSLLLRSLAVTRPRELVTFELDFADGYRQYNLGYSDFQSIRALRAVVRDASATSWAESFDVKSSDGRLVSTGASTRVSVVTGNYFDLLGVRAQRGRTFATHDDGDEMGAHAVLVISDAYWQRAFDREPNVVGRTVRVNGTPFTIIGVAPASFRGDWVGWPTDMWAPSSMVFVLHPEAEGRPRNRYQFKVLARLQPDAGLERTQAAVDLLYAQLLRNPPDGSGIRPGGRLTVVSAATGYAPQRSTFARPLTVLMVIVASVLLIACANLANLQLARGVAREREIAMRIALGAGRGRVLRQLMTEAVLLSLLGGACGLVVASLGMRLLAVLAAGGPGTGIASGNNPIKVELTLGIDPRALGFTVVLCFVTSIVFGLAPAFRGASVPLLSALGLGDARSNRGKRSVVRSSLVVAQIALSLLLVAVTGLFVRTLRNLQTQFLGYDRARTLLVWTLPGHTGRPPNEIARMWDRIQAEMASLPGVSAVGISVEGLLSGGPTAGPRVTRQSGPSSDSVRVTETMTISPQFFAAAGQPLRAGREFSRVDTGSLRVVIVNETLARRLFGAGAQAVGEQIRLAGSDVPYVVVGVVADARQNPRAPAGPALYYPAGQNLRRLTRGMCIVLRANGASTALGNLVRQQLARTEPTLPIVAVNTLAEQRDEILFQERLIAALAVGFAALAVLLSAIGLYGVVSYVTARRTREIGIRMALGATSGSVLRAVLSDSTRLAAVGIVVGLGLALLANTTIASLLYGVRSTDPPTLLLSVAVIVVASLVGSLLPAYRAARTHPIDALRVD